MKRLLNTIILLISTLNIFGQGVDNFISLEDWSNEIRDPEYITLYFAINSFQDPTPLNNYILIILLICIMYCIYKSFKNKSIKK